MGCSAAGWKRESFLGRFSGWCEVMKLGGNWIWYNKKITFQHFYHKLLFIDRFKVREFINFNHQNKHFKDFWVRDFPDIWISFIETSGLTLFYFIQKHLQSFFSSLFSVPLHKLDFNVCSLKKMCPIIHKKSFRNPFNINQKVRTRIQFPLNFLFYLQLQ